MADPDFARKIMPLVERLFPEADLRVEVSRPPGGQAGDFLPDVRVTHIPTGEVVVCANYGTQIENKVAAILELGARLDTR